MHMTTPHELVEAIARGDAVLFVGAGLSVGAGLPGWGQLLAPLADRLGLPAAQRGDPLRVAQYYNGQRGTNALIDYLREQLDTTGKRPTENHRRLLRLGIRTWVTTNFDDLLEQTLRDGGERFSKVVRDRDLPYASADRLTLIKLHGEIEQPETVVITQQDYATYFRRFPRVKEKLSSLLVDKTFLFVGYSISDPDFNQLIAEVGFDLQQHQRMAYAALFDADEFTVDDLRSRNISVLPLADSSGDRSAPLGALLDELIAALDAKRSRPGSTVHPAQGVDIPQAPTAPSISPAPAQPAAAAPSDGYEYDAFVSYNERDGDWVYATLLPPLERAGLRVCIGDRDFAIGLPKLINMENAVERSRKTLLILTPNWDAGEWNQFEGLLAQTSDPSGNRQRVLPVIAKPGALPRRLGYLTPLDLTNASRLDAQMQRLVATIRGTPAQPSSPAPATPAVVVPGPTPQSPPRAAGDGRLDYDRGLRVLERYVPADGGHDWSDFELFKGQLIENLADERRYGDTPTTRAARARLVDKLNQLALRLAGMSFNDVCLGRLGE
jgi:hypothetical protein